MISREIFERIRQTKVRGSRLTTEMFPGFSFQPSAQLVGVSQTVRNRNNGKDIVFDREVNAISLESFQTYFAGPAAKLAKNLRLDEGAFQHLKNFPGKFLSQAGAFTVVPSYGLKELLFCGRLENKLQTHSQPKRCRISALTCSKGKPPLGFFSNSASRRSSS